MIAQVRVGGVGLRVLWGVSVHPLRGHAPQTRHTYLQGTRDHSCTWKRMDLS